MSKVKYLAVGAAAILFASQASAQVSLTPTPGGVGVTGPSGNTVTLGQNGLGYIPADSRGYDGSNYAPQYGSGSYYEPSTSYYAPSTSFYAPGATYAPSTSYYAPSTSYYTPGYSTSYYAPSASYYPATSGSWGYTTQSYYGPTQRYSTGANVARGLINRALRR